MKKISGWLLEGKQIPFHFEAVLQDILFISAVNPSIKRGLIPEKAIILSGDGTCVHTHASKPFWEAFFKMPFQRFLHFP